MNQSGALSGIARYSENPSDIQSHYPSRGMADFNYNTDPNDPAQFMNLVDHISIEQL